MLNTRLIITLASLFIFKYQQQTVAFTVKLSNNGPAVVGAPVTFTADISDYQTTALITYEVEWTDKFHSRMSLPPAAHIVWNITYNTPGNKITSYITVRKYLVQIKVDTVNNETTVDILSTIPGSLKLDQKGLAEHRNFVSTKDEAVVTFVLYDPNGFFTNASMDFIWNIFPETPTPHLTYDNRLAANFTDASQTYLIVLSVIAFNDYQTRPDLYQGSFSIHIEPKDPISKLSITGDTWLKRGDLLKLDLSCSGSPPFSYCLKYRSGDINSSTQDCTSPIVTNDCSFYLIHYFSKVGNYKVVTVIDNDVDHAVSVVDVNIFDVATKPQMSVIVIPVVCSVLVLAIIVYGIAYYVHGRPRGLTVEEADFDFQTSDSHEYRTFLGQLKAEVLEVVGGRRVSRSNSTHSSSEYGTFP